MIGNIGFFFVLCWTVSWDKRRRRILAFFKTLKSFVMLCWYFPKKKKNNLNVCLEFEELLMVFEKIVDSHKNCVSLPLVVFKSPLIFSERGRRPFNKMNALNSNTKLPKIAKMPFESYNLGMF